MKMTYNRPIHFEILTKNPKEMSAFYTKIFGWKIATWEGPQTYWLVTTGPDDTAGINGGIMAKHFDQPVINTMWVESLDRALQEIEAAGGKKIQGPNEIPNVGMHAYCSDPDGNIFGILQPAGR